MIVLGTWCVLPAAVLVVTFKLHCMDKQTRQKITDVCLNRRVFDV